MRINIIMLVAFLFLLVMSVAAFPAVGVENDEAIVLPASQDSFIRKRGYDANEGANPILQAKYAVRPLVAFDQNSLMTILEGKTLLSAKLSLYIVKNGDNWGENGHMISVQRLLANWEEGNGWNLGNTISGWGSGVSWRCAIDNDISNNEADCETRWRGGKFAPETDSLLIMNGIVDQRIEFDVTNDVNDFLAGMSNYGWLIKKSDERQSGRIDFASSESANGPELVLTFAPEVNSPPINNKAPVANDDTATTDEDTSVIIDVLANDLDPDNDIISITSVSVPLRGLAAITDNAITYKPDDALNSLAAGEVFMDTFSYTVSDPAGATSRGAVQVAVSGVNEAPPPSTAPPTPPNTTPTYELRVSSFASFDGFLVYESSILGSYNVSIDHGNGVFYVESMHGSISATLSHTTGSGTASQSYALSEGEYRGINVSNGDSVLVTMSSSSRPVEFAFVFDPA